ncbi:hypothetical protein CSUI_002574 [Cystoisospora suis]|uniref:Uncharacterized protein n=1 Tax=Cystoisospora suis TaxID=483139 RepID=A0A2C6L601_9APIC|nr:hypothetical protein CSUI_002574 [Cystoisospora suis]
MSKDERKRLVCSYAGSNERSYFIDRLTEEEWAQSSQFFFAEERFSLLQRLSR